MAPAKSSIQVHCRNCQAGNLPGSPYCSSCGAPLADAKLHNAQSTGQLGGSVVADPVVRFGADGQDRAIVKQMYERATSILTEGETIEYIATAHGGLGRAPDCAVATNKRVMLFRKKVLGKVELDDCWWRDVGAATLIETKSGMNLKLDAIQGWHLIVENLPKTQAVRVYDLAFEHGERLQAMGKPANYINPEQTGPTQMAQVVPTSPNLTTSPPRFFVQAENPGQSAVHITQPGMSIDTHPAATNEQVTPIPPPVPANYIPTPESVLQSILQGAGLEEGLPTRPMQWSAAFQGPAVAEVQPVMLSENRMETDPKLRITPPLTTLERIAVFTQPSGPLSLDTGSRLSSHLTSSKLESGSLPSTPLLDHSMLFGSLADNEPPPVFAERVTGPTSGPLLRGPITADMDDAPVEVAEIPEMSFADSVTVMPTSPILGSGHLASRTSEPLAAAEADLEEAPVTADHEPVEVEASAPQSTSAIEAATAPEETPYAPFNNAQPTSPIGTDDYHLPMPGSLASGPLLVAQGEMDEELEELYRTTSAMATQRLDYEAPVDTDQQTRINLSLHNTPPMQATPANRISGGLNKGGSRTAGTGRAGAKDDPIAKMKQLKTLLDSGLITEDDYLAKKADILSRI